MVSFAMDHWLLKAYNTQWCYLRDIIQANVVDTLVVVIRGWTVSLRFL
jgi:hypothetical protein